MKCCASPTTSTAEVPDRARGGASGQDADVAFTALLTSLTLRPLAKPLGFYGESVIDACASSIARSLPGRVHVSEVEQ